jgi:hypothetical protein
MSCEHLICARCAHPVVEGRCPACRATRGELHEHAFASLQSLLIAVVVLLLVMAGIATAAQLTA